MHNQIERNVWNEVTVSTIRRNKCAILHRKANLRLVHVYVVIIQFQSSLSLNATVCIIQDSMLEVLIQAGISHHFPVTRDIGHHINGIILIDINERSACIFEIMQLL